MENLAHWNKYTGDKQLLSDHLLETAEMSSTAIPFEILGFKTINWRDVKRVAYLSGLFHDVGKYTGFFQDYLKKDVQSKYSRHSHVSACILYNWLKNVYPTKKYDENDLKNCFGISQNVLAYTAVKSHHGNLSGIPIEKDLLSEDETLNIIYDNLSKSENVIKTELNTINKTNITITDKNILGEKFYFKTVPHLLQSRMKSEEWFFYLQLIFSILVDNDKLNSAGIKRNINTLTNPDVVNNYIQKKCKKNKNTKNGINQKRDDFRIAVLKKLNSLSDEDIKNNGIYTITAPTGIGKTLTSVQVALQLSNRLNKIYNYNSRIITAIPFINIIEQTKNDYKEIFGEDKILVHHRFAISEDQKENEKDINKDYLNLEAWNSEIVLTTFVQFFHSILTGKNRLLKKLNKLVGSIVILDEIQSIPEKYYPLVGWLLKKLSDYYGTKLILMTATKPKIIEFANKLSHENKEIRAIELFEDNKKYFKANRRTQLVPVFEKKITTEELIDFVSEKYPEEGSMLIVVNTIRRSLEVYKELTNKYKNTDVLILYLSTNIIPLARKKVIDRAKDLIKQNGKVIMVSTQTIEAGVDLDFDQGVRDLAPITSIIQTAGRVNRESEKENHRPLYIVELEKDHDMIYNLPEMYSTKKLLNRVINEEDYFDTIDQYYTKQLVSSVSDESVDIIEEGIKKLDYEEIEKFELIKNLLGIVDVFVEYDEKSTQLADEYEATRELLKKTSKDKKYEYKVKLKNTLKKMGNYIISVRVNRLKDGNKPPEFSKRKGVEADFLWIPPDTADGLYYNAETGFKDESCSAFIF